MGRLGALHNLFSVCLANSPKSGTLETPHQSSLSFLFAQKPKDPIHRSLLGKHTWTATKTLQGQTQSDQHIFFSSCHRHPQLCYWMSLASNTQIAPFHKENPPVKPIPKPKCPCTWNISTPWALWLYLQNPHRRENGTQAFLELCWHLPAPQQSYCDTDAVKFGRIIIPHAQESFDFLQAPSVLHLSPGQLTTSGASTIKCSGKQVRLKIHCNKHLKICLLSQVWKASGAGTWKYSCSQGSLKIPDLLLFGNTVFRDNQPLLPLLHWTELHNIIPREILLHS